MNDPIASAASVPLSVSLISPVLKFLIAAGVPFGYNGLITIRGRKSGLPRTAAVAIIDVSGRRWVWAPWGDVHWVLNLRAAGGATITVRRRKEEVTATELDPDERVGFFRDVLGPVARGIPFGMQFVRVVDGVDLKDPVKAAEGRVVFELHALSAEAGPTTPRPDPARRTPSCSRRPRATVSGSAPAARFASPQASLLRRREVASLGRQLPRHRIVRPRSAAKVQREPEQPLLPADADGARPVLGPHLVGHDRGVLELEPRRLAVDGSRAGPRPPRCRPRWPPRRTPTSP